jgi:hypothetical protein
LSQDENTQHQFQKCDESQCDTKGIPYDCHSIMHYGATLFSTEAG